MRLPSPTLEPMAVYVWQQAMDPDFPLAALEYRVHGDGDPVHWHDHLEVALVLEGRGVFVLGRRALEAEAGDVFFVDNSQQHVAHASRGQSMRLLLVLFRPELIAPAGCRELERGYLAPFLRTEGCSPRVHAGTALATQLAGLLTDLAAAALRRDPAERHVMDATLRLVLGLVNRDPATGASPDAVRAAAGRREQIRPVLAHVDRCFREPIALADVAALVHVSPSRLRHVFKDVTGVSFREHLTQVRVAEAKHLLLDTELSVADVARSVAYTNLSQFYKVFVRFCGMSPGEYRRHYAPPPVEPGRAPEAPEPAAAGR